MTKAVFDVCMTHLYLIEFGASVQRKVQPRSDLFMCINDKRIAPSRNILHNANLTLEVLSKVSNKNDVVRAMQQKYN